MPMLKYYFAVVFLVIVRLLIEEAVAPGEGEKSRSHGSFENPEISFKKEEIPNYVYRKYDTILLLTENTFMF